jgi:glycosyltransferase involved in cell wall biosynthesis
MFLFSLAKNPFRSVCQKNIPKKPERLKRMANPRIVTNLDEILQISPTENIGGAARIAWNLQNGYKMRGFHATMAVAEKNSLDPDVIKIPILQRKTFDERVFCSLYEGLIKSGLGSRDRFFSDFLRRLGSSRQYWKLLWGIENFEFPGSQMIIETLPNHPQIVHLHNLHSDYFDLNYLTTLSHQIPTLLTLHDTWLFSGHCAHYLDCQRWQTGCGKCPHLDIYPSLRHDSTAQNWKNKKKIFERSSLYIAAPSNWLAEQIPQSILNSSVQKIRVINNGVDLSIFKLSPKNEARAKLQLPADEKILLFTATNPQVNPFKDYDTIEAAIKIVARRIPNIKIIFLALGSNGNSFKMENANFKFIPYSTDPNIVATYYQAADVYLHAAFADTYPNVVLEAMACGTPVIGTNVGGIPEQIIDGQTGYIIPARDNEAMAMRIVQFILDRDLQINMGLAASSYAQAHFSVDRMVDEYLEYYQEIVTDWQIKNG